jgi:hypothetical protein
VFTARYDLSHSMEFRIIVVPREINRRRVARAFETFVTLTQPCRMHAEIRNRDRLITIVCWYREKN